MASELNTLDSQPCVESYDRSSLRGDYMVVIEGQTEDDWWRRSPENQICEYLDGLVYFHPPKGCSHEELEAARGIYDRSSLIGDFMVILEDQASEDFEKYAPEDAYCDYLEGRVYMPSPVSARHQRQVGFFYRLLDFFREKRGGWDVLFGPAVLRLDDHHKPEPDVFVLPLGVNETPAPAIFIIEVISTSTRSHDFGRKLQAYKDAQIPEIWLVDERDQQLVAERLRGDVYVRESYTSGIVSCDALPGFWIDLEWLWSEPLPGASACMTRILAGPPA